MSIRDVPSASVTHADRMAYAGQLLREITHDIKSPLTAIIGALEVMIGSGGKLTPAQQALLLKTSLAEAYRLDHFIHNLSLYQRLQLQDGKFEKTSTPLKEVFRALRAKLHHRHPHVSWPEKEVDILLSVEPRWFAEALWQILDNAGRHNKHPVQLFFTIEEQVGQIALTISDQGAGIPAALARTLFDPYSKEDGNNDQIRAGLGLTIARDIMRRHGGDLHLVAQPTQDDKMPASFLIIVPAN
jgi:two-component system, OmpR family, sensor histidine kinase KdpD